MADLLSGGVMRGLIGASTAMKSADAAMGVYVYAKAKKDDAMMERALGHMTDNMSAADQAVEESQKALEENVQAAREQERLEREAEIGKAESAEERAAADEANGKITHPVDTVEISPEAAAAWQEEQSFAPAQAEAETEHAEIPAPRTEQPVSARTPHHHRGAAGVKPQRRE